MPVIPALWEVEVGNHLRSGVQHQPGQHGETPSLLKIEQSGQQEQRKLCLNNNNNNNCQTASKLGT